MSSYVAFKHAGTSRHSWPLGHTAGTLTCREASMVTGTWTCTIPMVFCRTQGMVARVALRR